MNTTPPLISLAHTAAVLLTIGHFNVGSIPTAGHTFPGVMHWMVRLSTHALMAFAYGLGWTRRLSAQIAAFVASIGAIHEIAEITTHSRGLKLEDIVVNAEGALSGAATQRVSLRAIFP